MLGSTGKQLEHSTESQKKTISSKRLNQVNIKHSFKPDDIILADLPCSDASGEASGPPSPREGDIRNFGEISAGIYRSSFPGSCNIEHLQSLKLKTLITLVTTPFEPQVERWLSSKDVKHYRINIPAHKTSEDVIPMEAIAQVMALLTDDTKRPILMHCNKGKHRTGCVVACFRKLQGMDDVNAITEYHNFARPKVRAFDVAFISRLRAKDVITAISSLKTSIEPLCNHHNDHAIASKESMDILGKGKAAATDEKGPYTINRSRGLDHQVYQVNTLRQTIVPEPPLSPATAAVSEPGLSVNELVDALSRIDEARHKDTLTPPSTPAEKNTLEPPKSIDGTYHRQMQ